LNEPLLQAGRRIVDRYIDDGLFTLWKAHQLIVEPREQIGVEAAVPLWFRGPS
jgi:hypothetical protein